MVELIIQFVTHTQGHGQISFHSAGFPCSVQKPTGRNYSTIGAVLYSWVFWNAPGKILCYVFRNYVYFSENNNLSCKCGLHFKKDGWYGNARWVWVGEWWWSSLPTPPLPRCKQLPLYSPLTGDRNIKMHDQGFFCHKKTWISKIRIIYLCTKWSTL